MAWYVIATAKLDPGSSGVSTAAVIQYKNAADFQAHTGYAPGSAQDPVAGQPPGGYPSRAAAQAAADKYNKLPAAGRQAGTLPNPNADTVLPPGLKVPSPLTGWTHNIEQWLIRGFEMLLGLGLIIVAVAKLASDTPIGRTAVKAGKAAMIL